MQLLRRFAVEGLLYVFPVRDMPAHGSVPPQRQQVLVRPALLKVDFAGAVDDMEVHYRMQELRASVAPGTGRLCSHKPAGLDYGQHLFCGGDAASGYQRCGFFGRIYQFYHR